MAKKKKEKPVHELTEAELKERHVEISRKLYDLKCEYHTNRKLDKPHLLKTYKREIARVLTVLNSKKG